MWWTIREPRWLSLVITSFMLLISCDGRRLLARWQVPPPHVSQLVVGGGGGGGVWSCWAQHWLGMGGAFIGNELVSFSFHTPANYPPPSPLCPLNGLWQAAPPSHNTPVHDEGGGGEGRGRLVLPAAVRWVQHHRKLSWWTRELTERLKIRRLSSTSDSVQSSQKVTSHWSIKSH